MTDIRFAFDRSARRVDQDGRLHVEITNISKANVCPYRGSEIPAEGLNPDQIYMMYRDADELARAAWTFNNIPLLSKHVPVSADDPMHELVMGSTGTDAEFVAPYLRNSLVVWDAKAIAGIESRDQCELSCAYRYRAEMTPGNIDGVAFDGIMRDIVGNHVALVEAGRAGPDVVVGDQQLECGSMLKSKKALLARGALVASVRPLMATDGKVDFDVVLKGVNRANFAGSHDIIMKRLETATRGKLAADASLEPIKATLLALDKEDCEGEDEMDEPDAEDKEDDEKAEEAKAEDEEGEEDKTSEAKAEREAKDKKAMDAAISKAVRAALSRRDAVDEAKREVRAHVGDLTGAFDSANEVYKLALDAAMVDTTGIDPVAFGPMVRMLPKPGEVRKIAMDRADAGKDAASMFPALSLISQG